MTTPARSRVPAMLDPFALPSDTTFRFALLIALVIASTLATMERTVGRVPVWRDQFLAEADACMTRVQERQRAAAVSGIAPAPGPFGLPAGGLGDDCVALVNRPHSVKSAIATATVLVTAALLYWLTPWWMVRRDRLEPITAESGGELHTALLAASARAGLDPPPTFVWNLALGGGTALAFGRLGKRYVFVPSGLVGLFMTAPDRFHAIVFHELAHHRNRDIDLTYFAMAVWRAYIVLAVLPFVAALLTNGLAFDTIPMAWRLAALVALVLLARNAVLRSREVYADARAALWLGGSGAVAAALDVVPEPRRQRWLRWIPASVRQWVATHPERGRRRALLDDASPLFYPGNWEALATGLATALVVPYLVSFFSRLHVTPGLALGPFLLSLIVCAPLIVGVLGTGAWRQAYRDRVAPGVAVPRRRLGQAESLSIGAVLGSALPLSAWFELRGFEGTYWWLSAISAFAAWGALVLVTSRALVAWLLSGARAWLARDDVLARPAPACAAALASASIVGLAWLTLVMYAHPLIGGFTIVYRNPAFGGVLPALAIPLVSVAAATVVLPAILLIAAAAALWAYPVASLYWPGAGDDVRARRIALRRTFVSGLRVAAVHAAIVLAVRLIIRMSLQGAEMSDGGKVITHFSAILLGVVLQASLARRVARRATWLPAIEGLFAAFVAACAMLLLYHFVNAILLGGGMEAAFLAQTLWQYVGAGALAALIGLGLQRRTPAR